MAVYLITYELKSVGRNYDDLYNEIKSIGNAIKPLDNVWFVSSITEDAFQIRDRLVLKKDPNDGIIIVEVSTGIAGSHDYGKTTADWILDQLR